MFLTVYDKFLTFYKSADEVIVSRIEKNTDGFFLVFPNTTNDFIFNYVGIKDPFLFQDEILGYTTGEGNFPYCYTREDVIKLANAIVDYYNKRVTDVNNPFFLRKTKYIKFKFNI